jgi:hypothetical protein
VIKVVDNAAPVFLDCPSTPVFFCDGTNNDPAQYGSRCEGPVDLHVKVTDVCSKTDITLSYRLYLDLDGNGTMETYKTSSQPGAWPIETSITADTVFAKVKLPNGLGLPYGRHKIEWIANDGCGNQSLCKYEFDVKDCIPPTIVCINGLSVNIMPTGMIVLWASDFIHYFFDNCTPNDLIKIAIRKAGTGTGFPDFETSVTFDCNEIGQQLVEVWAIDACGNADFCQTYVIVQDNNGICVPPGPISGIISTPGQQPVPGVMVQLKSNLPGIVNQSSSPTNADGKYEFPHAPGTCNYSIQPALDTLPLLGLNTLDVLLTNWHINGTEPFATPYQHIAADANHDAVVDALDLDAMGNLIVGTASQFPNNTAWRFVPSDFVFPGGIAPLASNFPEKISTTCPAPSGENHHLFAVKTGDVDISANLSNIVGGLNSRSGETETAMFKMANQRFNPGDEVTATLISPDLSSVLGFQFTIYANQNMLELKSAEPLLNEKLALFPDLNCAALSWHTKEGEKLGEMPVLKLTFKALQSGSLKQAIQFNPSITKDEAYNPGRQTMNVALSFILTSQTIRSQLKPVSPNPVTSSVPVVFFIPESGNVTLSLSNASGTIVSSSKEHFEAGWSQTELPLGQAGNGMYFLQMSSEFGKEVQKVMVQR